MKEGRGSVGSGRLRSHERSPSTVAWGAVAPSVATSDAVAPGGAALSAVRPGTTVGVAYADHEVER
ncbi:MAG: hypothetical protein M0013_00140 [Actinomycetota bacterium]|nr:hypothetical protein [Actinomycetota bacterium]